MIEIHGDIIDINRNNIEIECEGKTIYFNLFLLYFYLFSKI